MTEFRKAKPGCFTVNEADLRAAYYRQRIAVLTTNIDEMRQIMSESLYQVSDNSEAPETGTDKQRQAAWLAHLRGEKEVLVDQCRFLMDPKRLWLFDQRDRNGTGALISLGRYGASMGSGRVVFFIDGEPQTSCCIKKFKLDGQEVTCDPSHRVVRHWKDGELVPSTNTPIHGNGGRG